MGKKDIYKYRKINKIGTISNNGYWYPKLINREFEEEEKRNNDCYETIMSFKEIPKTEQWKQLSKECSANTNNTELYSGWALVKEFQPILERIVLDIDIDKEISEEERFETAKRIAHSIINDLDEYSDYINVYISGGKGFHIEIITEPLDIVDVNVDKPMYAVIQYTQFLTYFNNKYDELDLSLKDVGVRILRKHHSKHKSGKYKVLVDINADIEDIISASKKNQDMVDLKKKMPEAQAMQMLKQFQAPIGDGNETTIKYVASTESYDITPLSDKLCSIHQSKSHDKIIPQIAFSCMGYLNKEQANQILDQLKTNDRLNESTNNLEGTFWDCYNDAKYNGLGSLYKALELHIDIKDNNEREKRQELFNEFKEHLEFCKSHNKGVRIKDNYYAFRSLLDEYDNDIVALFDDKLITYRKNSESLFKGIIYSLSSSLGLSSQIVNINAPSGGGKTEYIKTLNDMTPNFLMQGGCTAKSLYREDDDYFNLKSVYFGDWGLNNNEEEKEGIIKIIRELMTDNLATHTITANDNRHNIKLILEADALSVFITELYTKKYQQGLGEQLINKSQNININKLSKRDGVEILYYREIGKNDNDFRLMHRDYVQYLIINSQLIPLDMEIIDEMYEDMRTTEMDIVYYKVFCIYFGYNPNDKSNIAKYQEIFKKEKLTKIEKTWLNTLQNNFRPIKVDKDGNKQEDVSIDSNIINSTKTIIEIKNKETGEVEKRTPQYTYFTVKRIKSYLRSRINNNGTLRQSEDYLSDILNVLMKKDFISYEFEKDIDKDRIYYLIEKTEEEEHQE